MNSKYGVFNFHEYPNRIDVKMIDYNKSERKKYHAKHPLVKMSKVMEEVKSPAVFEDGLTYKYYDTSIESVTEKGEFKNYKLISKQNKPSRAKQKAIKDTIIVANLKTNKSKATIVTENEDGSIVSSGYLMIKPKGNIDIEYLKTVFHSPQIIYYLRQICSTGLGMANWSFNDLANVKIPLPPIEEQRRTLPIVKEKIARLEEKIKELEKEKEKNSLQNIIDRAFEEELNIATPSNKYNRYGNNVISSKHFIKEFLIDDSPLDFKYAVPFMITEELRKKFKTVRLKDILTVPLSRGKFVKNIDKITGYHRIMVKNINDNILTLDLNSLDNISKLDWENGGDSILQKGDILFSMYGAGSLGKISFNSENINAIIDCHVAIIRLKESLNKEFIFYYLKSYLGQQQMLRCVSGTTGQVSIALPKMSNILIPILDEGQMDKILNKINAYKKKFITYIKKINLIETLIDSDLNRYILEGYSDDLFEINDEDYLI